jgi:membrane protein YqaA with SNARE-associated domain
MFALCTKRKDGLAYALLAIKGSVRGGCVDWFVPNVNFKRLAEPTPKCLNNRVIHSLD